MQLLWVLSVANSLVVHEGVADPLKTLLCLDHMCKQCPLEKSMVVGNVLIKLLVASSYLDHQKVRLELKDELGKVVGTRVVLEIPLEE